MNFIYTILSITCLIFGFCNGYKIGKDNEIPKIPKEIKHPIKAMKDHHNEVKEEERQNEILEELQQDLEILDNYDGGISN